MGGGVKLTIFFFVYSAANVSFLGRSFCYLWFEIQGRPQRLRHQGFSRDNCALCPLGGDLAADGHTTDRTNEQYGQAAPPSENILVSTFLNLTYKNNLKKLQKNQSLFFLNLLFKKTWTYHKNSVPSLRCTGREDKEVVWWNKLRLVVFLAATKDKDIFIYL